MSATGSKQTALDCLVRLIRGSRKSSNPAAHHSTTWEFLNLKIRDSTYYLPTLEVGPESVNLEVIILNPNAKAVVVELWTLKATPAHAEGEKALAANRVFLHALLGYLKSSEFYPEVLGRADVRCRLSTSSAAQLASPAMDTMWAKSDDAGVSVMCQYNKLWKRELADLLTGSLPSAVEGDHRFVESSEPKTPARSPEREEASAKATDDVQVSVTDEETHQNPPSDVPSAHDVVISGGKKEESVQPTPSSQERKEEKAVERRPKGDTFIDTFTDQDLAAAGILPVDGDVGHDLSQLKDFIAAAEGCCSNPPEVNVQDYLRFALL